VPPAAGALQQEAPPAAAAAAAKAAEPPSSPAQGPRGQQQQTDSRAGAHGHAGGKGPGQAHAHTGAGAPARGDPLSPLNGHVHAQAHVLEAGQPKKRGSFLSGEMARVTHRLSAAAQHPGC
jgi:hypothetical protein